LSTSFGFTVLPLCFLVVDLAAGGVLLAVDLLTLLAGELAAVGFAVVVDLLVDVGLRALGAGRFAGSHLAAAQAVGDALVLVGLAGVGVVVAAGRAVGGRDGLRLRVLLRHLVIRIYVGLAVVPGRPWLTEASCERSCAAKF
jgi:hypothetical protein